MRFTSTFGKTLGTLAASSMIMLAACGGSDDKPENAAATGEAPPAAAPAGAGEAVSVRSATTGLGDILVGEDGLTLYGFTNDVNAVSTCSGTCAEAWPPVLVDADWTVGPGLDSGVFSTVQRDDGTSQLMAGKWPLYYYSGDSTQGDLLGQGSGGVWFAVNLDATLNKDPAPPAGEGGGGEGEAAASGNSVDVVASPLGEILVDGDGNTLYAFTNDEAGAPTCTGDCAATWPAHLIEGDAIVGPNLDTAVFSLVDGAEGGKQLKAGKWPLYRFSGDAKPGDVNGQGSGGVWFVVAADGTLIKDAPGASGGEDTGDSGSADEGSSDGGY